MNELVSEPTKYKMYRMVQKKKKVERGKNTLQKNIRNVFQKI